MLLPKVFTRPEIKEYFSDLFPDPTVGLSVRILNRNHDGSLFQIRRNADDVEVIVLADFNDEISLNSLVQNVNEGLGDTLAGNLGEFVGASGFNNPDGLASADYAFVVIWFEQFFSNHASQSTASAQPQIVNAGTVVKENGQPALLFDGVDDALFANNSITSGSYSFYVVHNAINSPNIGKSILGDADANPLILFQENKGFQPYIEPKPPYPTTQTLIHIALTNSSFTEVLLNGIRETEIADGSPLGADSILPIIGSRNDGSGYLNGKIQELIIYSSDQSANRSNIEANINSYYLIY